MVGSEVSSGGADSLRARAQRLLETRSGGLLAAGATGLLYAAGFDPLNLWPLSWVCLVPLLWALRRATPWRGAALGGLAGAVGALGSVYWLWLPLTHQYHYSPPVALLFLLGVAAYVGAFYALIGATQTALESWDPPGLPFLVAGLWVAGELLRSRLGAGVPWLLAGHTQVLALPAVQVADLGGVYAVSFLVVSVNRGLLGGLAERRWRGAALVGCLLVVALAYGAARLTGRAESTSASLRVAVVQPSIPQQEKWDREQFGAGMRRLYDLSQQALQRPEVSLVVWPETALTVDLERAHETLAPVARLLKVRDAELLLGAPRILGSGGTREVRNSAALLRPDGTVGAPYDKQILLPFGEYYPTWVGGVPGLRGLVEAHMGPLEFTPGGGPTLLQTRAGRRLGAPICYEATYPELVGSLVSAGAEVLINLTNDAWFEESAGAAQHLAMARLRAVEHRIPLLRAANTGISALILPSGALRSRLGIGERGVLEVDVPIVGVGSVYTRVGDLFALCCCLVVAAALGLRALRRWWPPGRVKE